VPASFFFFFAHSFNQLYTPITMRAKRQKLYKRAMHSYQSGFGFRTPYQILRKLCNSYGYCGKAKTNCVFLNTAHLVDGEFCQEGLKHKIYMKEVLQQTLMGPTKQRKWTDLIMKQVMLNSD
jgi:hypothetical protein